MKYAVVKENAVENVIVADAAQKAELEAALGAELVDAQPFNLQIGDLRVGADWTRNQDGEQIVLTGKPTYDELLAQIAALQTQVNDGNEIIDIMEGN